MFNVGAFKLLAIIAFPAIILPASEGASAKYIGCFRDFFFPRVMHWGSGAVHSIEECLKICSWKKDRYAGLQYGKQCFCSGRYSKYGGAHNCNMKCKSGQTCGGFLANSVYEIVNPCHWRPCKNGGTCIKKGHRFTCICRPGYSGRYCNILNPCYKKPCKNGGISIRKGRRFTCKCRRGYIGRYRRSFNPCYKKPCKNGGACIRRGRRFICKCRRGYIGRYCRSFNPCHRRPCKSGGLCIRKGRSFTCKCRPGYSGRYCNIFNRCHRRPCKNGGFCIRKGSSFTCKCRPGYSGRYCNILINPCLRISFKNRRTCFRRGRKFFCTCRPGYSGICCTVFDPCHTKPCKNGGTCIRKGHSFTCKCKPGYSGSYCNTFSACGNAVADIMFVLDDSGSISKKDFLVMKTFVKKLVSTFPISSNAVQVGIITFSTNVKNQFNLNKFRNILDLNTAIDRIAHIGGWTHTYAALNYLKDSSFTAMSGDRKDVLNIAVVITDGNSNNQVLTVKAAEKVKKSGTMIFAIGVGKKISNTELKAIGSEPSSKYVFSVNSFDVLQSISSTFSAKACNASKPCICKVSGDLHYDTFDGQLIHFMGTCKYTLATIKNGSNNTYFSVEVKNEHRGNNRISCTRLVDVKLTGFTIRLLPANKILINSEEKSLPVRNYKEFSATYSVGWITVTTEWGLKIMFDGRHRVTVTLPPIFADQLTGICGDCNGEKDDFRPKSGEDVSQKANKFSLIGASYQVEDDSDKPETKCKVNDVNSTCSKEQTKECDLMNDKIFEACIEKIGASHLEEYLESCRIDVCSYHNDPTNHHSVFCRIIEGFATECESVGIFVNWREISQCPMKCKEKEEFQYKTSSCQPSCADRSPNCTGSSQGCVCRQGFILSGEQCVPETECGCIDNKIYMKVNEEIISADCKTKKICKPGNEVVTEDITPCGENSHCGIERGRYACVCKENFILQNGKCVHTGE
ncbi:uncharacterized protein LOC115229549 [Octopus sinensis]|uniref:Uncharacterized protein LOC115229549 n=1 Tax=Octopus sinensis TaxID=2607531 RepID=A0A7E6EIP6_9MOLL|nr:uncharacterized protein LOC115229549 [Octopus sinensis]